MRGLFFTIAWAGMIAMVWSIFRRADRAAAKSATPLNFDGWASSGIRPRLDAFPALFVWVFDATFGRRLASFRCLLLSWLASAVVSILLFMLLQPIFRGTPLDLFNPGAESTIRRMAANYGYILLVIILCSLIPGYFSLAATRCILGHATRSVSSRNSFAYLATDFVVTLLIMYVSTIVYMSIGTHLTGFLDMPLGAFLKMLLIISKDLLLFNFNTQFHYFYAIPFYAIFWPSFWMWISLIATIAASFLRGTGADTLWKAKQVIDIDHAPVRALGRLAAIILLTAFAVATALMLA